MSELWELKAMREEDRRAEDAGGGFVVGQDDPAGGTQKKMVGPKQRRAGVAWAREASRIPERWACRVMAVPRSTVRYESVRPSQ